jgi:uncharacterized tellurite resistance protein B-like protein
MTENPHSTALQGNVIIVETPDGPLSYDGKFLVAALLIFVAKGSGRIEPEESSLMIRMLGDYFNQDPAASLELLTHAVSEMRDKPWLGKSLADFAGRLADDEKEDIALMALKVIAADGRREVEEMEQFNTAVAAANIAPQIVHRAFDRYFAETMPDATDGS